MHAAGVIRPPLQTSTQEQLQDIGCRFNYMVQYATLGHYSCTDIEVSPWKQTQQITDT